MENIDFTEVAEQIPRLRFKGFRNRWTTNLVRQIVRDKKGAIKIGPFGSQLKKNTFVKQGYKVYGQENIFLNDFTFGDRYITEDHFKSLKSNEISPNDFIISTMGTIGKCTIVPESIRRGIMDSHIIRLKLDEHVVNSSFLSQLFTSSLILKQVKSLSVGGIMDGLSIGIINELKLNLPSLPEQQKIASFLSAVDKKIQQLTRKKELLEQYKKGVMQKIFAQEIRFKDEHGKHYPEWEEKRLGKITNKVGKKNKKNIQYPIYSINNKEGFLPQGDQFEGVDSSNRGYDISMYKIIQPKTFAYNPARINVGSIGYSGTLNDIIISSLYVCFQTTEELDDEYLLQFLSTYNFNKSVLRNVEGGVRDYLFYDNFSHIKIPLPSIGEQKVISKYLSIIDNKIEFQNSQIARTQQFKKGLLQKMFI